MLQRGGEERQGGEGEVPPCPWRDWAEAQPKDKPEDKPEDKPNAKLNAKLNAKPRPNLRPKVNPNPRPNPNSNAQTQEKARVRPRIKLMPTLNRSLGLRPLYNRASPYPHAPYPPPPCI